MTVAVHATETVEIRRVLAELLVRSEADECLLCDTAGHVLAHEGASREDPFPISALSAGVFAASRKLAAMLGESEFNTVLHQGVSKGILIRAVNADVLLVTLFTHAASIVGLIQLYSGPAVVELQNLFAAVRRRNDEVPAGDQRPFVLRDQDLFTPQP
jgi:predicted regulator of Ras-like GTPase activity (Roadblock/LC7/MglB family)